MARVRKVEGHERQSHDYNRDVLEVAPGLPGHPRAGQLHGVRAVAKGAGGQHYRERPAACNPTVAGHVDRQAANEQRAHQRHRDGCRSHLLTRRRPG